MTRRLLPIVLGSLIALPAVGLAQPTDLTTYTLFGDITVRIGSDTTVPNGNVGSHGQTALRSRVVIDGTAAVAGNFVKLGGDARAAGDVFYNILRLARGSSIGPSHFPIGIPFVTLPPPPTVLSPDRPPLELPAGGTQIGAAPGRYPRLSVGTDATLILSGGQYDVGEMVMRRGSQLMCFPPPAVCTVRVATRLNLAGARVGGSDSSTVRGPMSFEFAGTRSVSVGRSGAQVEATVIAPLATLGLKSSRRTPSTFVGRFVGREIRVGSAATVSLTPGVTPVCPDGVVQSPEECDPPQDSACPGQCLPDCSCAPPLGTPVLHSVGPSVLHNASPFGVQAFGEGFLPGAQLELADKTTLQVLATLPTTFIGQGELTALVPAGLPVPAGMQRELTATVINPGGFRSAAPDIGHCTVDSAVGTTVCTEDSDCPPGTGPCVHGDQRLTLFNDLVFLNPNSAAVVPDPDGVCDNGQPCQGAIDCTGIGSGACSPKLYVTPQQRDELWVFNTGTRQFVDKNPGQSGIQGIPVGDNPFHVEILAAGGPPRAWVVNRFDDSVSIIDPATDTELARLTGAALGAPGRLRMETEIEFNRAGTRAYLSNENLDEVQVLDIGGANRDAPLLAGTIDVGVNPRGMATNTADTRLYVANIQSAEVSVVDIEAGSATENQVIATIGARATDDIVGGRADGWEAFVISGRAPRGIVFSDAQNALFVTSIGPQTGPRAGVSQVGGAIINPTITVIDAGSDTVVAHVALTGLDRDRPTCTDPELMALDDARGRLYVTCQGSGTVDVLDTAALTAGTPAELAIVGLPLPVDATVPTLSLNPVTGAFGAKVCAAFTSNPGVACTTDANCTGCPATRDGLPVLCCATNNPIGLHNGPRGIALSGDRNRLYVVNQFTTAISTLDVSAGSAGGAFVQGTTSFPDAFGSDTPQRDRRLGQIEFFTDVKKTNTSCATCHIDDHQDGVFFEADVVGPRLRRVLSVRGTRDFPPLLQDQLLPDLVAFTDIVVHIERGGPICTPCTELGGSFFCFPAPEGTCTQTSNSETQQNTLYAKGVTFFPNPNLNADGSFSTAVPLPGGGTGDAVRGEAVFEQLGCATCHAEPLFTLDQFRIFTVSSFSSIQSRRMREVGTPVHLPLRNGCQDASRPTGVDGSTGFGVPTLRGIWDTFPLLMSGAAGFQVVGPEPVFSPGCQPGAAGCCTQLQSPLNPGGISVPEQHLAVGTKDPIRALLTAPLAVPGTGHGAALGVPPSDLDALIAYLRSL